MATLHCAGHTISGDHFIGGTRRSSSRTLAVTSPIDGTALGEIAAGDAADATAAVDAATTAFPAWASLGPSGRGPVLRRLADLIERDVATLALVETTNNGSLLEASRLRVMKRAAHNVRFFADLAESLSAPAWDTDAANAHNRVAYDPAGPTALITPWNAPLMLATWKVGPALAAGNTVVLKPAEWTPSTASMLADLSVEAGVPPGVLNVLQGLGPEAGAALVAHPGIRRISFTGSPPTARLIGQAAAASLTPVSFELGGKSPLIVCDDADMDLAVATAAGQYDNAGQVCLAGTRLLVQASVLPEFATRLRAKIAEIRQGDPRDPATHVGPLIHPKHLARVAGYVERAVAAGARVVCGGRVSPALGGLYYEPTLLTDVPDGAEILREEVFGPVLTLQSFRDDDEAIALANGTSYGLAGVVFTRDQARADEIARQLVAGTVWVNCFFVRDLSAPFGGARQSGIGREGGHWSFDFYCDVKNVVHRKGTFAPAHV
jgi:aminomuconate-semialdehyde/2-hydroxymuconate-6-semialdehyde dehydrogenase